MLRQCKRPPGQHLQPGPGFRQSELEAISVGNSDRSVSARPYHAVVGSVFDVPEDGPLTEVGRCAGARGDGANRVTRFISDKSRDARTVKSEGCLTAEAGLFRVIGRALPSERVFVKRFIAVLLFNI